MLEQEELGGREQTDGGMSILGSVALKKGELENGRSLRSSKLYEADFAPGGAILRPPSTLLEQKGLAGLEEMEGKMSDIQSVREVARGERKIEEREVGALRRGEGAVNELVLKSVETAGKPVRTPDGGPKMSGDNISLEKVNGPITFREIFGGA
jgi:hypothetical protein